MHQHSTGCGKAEERRSGVLDPHSLTDLIEDGFAGRAEGCADDRQRDCECDCDCDVARSSRGRGSLGECRL
jgi:hypothetical protein